MTAKKVFIQRGKHGWWLLCNHINGTPFQLTSTSLYTLAPVIEAELHKNGWEEQLATQVRVQWTPCPLLLWGKVNSQKIRSQQSLASRHGCSDETRWNISYEQEVVARKSWMINRASNFNEVVKLSHKPSTCPRILTLENNCHFTFRCACKMGKKCVAIHNFILYKMNTSMRGLYLTNMDVNIVKISFNKIRD